MPPGRERYNGFSEAVFRWAQSNLDAALEWVAKLPPGSQKELMLTSVAARLAQQNPRETIDLALYEPNPNPFQPDPLLGFGPVGFVPLRDSFVRGFVAGLAEFDVTRAADYVSRLPAGNIQEQLLCEDPAEAVEWVAHAPASKAKDRALKSRAGYDSYSASRWLKQLPASPTRDTVIQHSPP